MNKGLGPKILALREEGNSYNKISKILHCSTSIVCYHVGNGQKDKYKKRSYKFVDKHPYINKYNRFISKTKHFQKLKSKIELKEIIKSKYDSFVGNDKMARNNFSVKDVQNKIGDNPTCYLTGDKIDIYKSRSYEFDHIIPRTRGGDNSLENLGIASRAANQAKGNMLNDEFFELCRKVLEHNGYKVEKL